MTTLKIKLWKAYWTVKMYEDHPQAIIVASAAGIALGLVLWQMFPVG